MIHSFISIIEKKLKENSVEFDFSNGYCSCDFSMGIVLVILVWVLFL